MPPWGSILWIPLNPKQHTFLLTDLTRYSHIKKKIHTLRSGQSITFPYTTFLPFESSIFSDSFIISTLGILYQFFKNSFSHRNNLKIGSLLGSLQTLKPPLLLLVANNGPLFVPSTVKIIQLENQHCETAVLSDPPRNHSPIGTPQVNNFDDITCPTPWEHNMSLCCCSICDRVTKATNV